MNLQFLVGCHDWMLILWIPTMMYVIFCWGWMVKQIDDAFNESISKIDDLLKKFQE